MKMKVAVTFKGSNYLVWSRMVKTAVGARVCGSISQLVKLQGRLLKRVTQRAPRRVLWRSGNKKT